MAHKYADRLDKSRLPMKASNTKLTVKKLNDENCNTKNFIFEKKYDGCRVIITCEYFDFHNEIRLYSNKGIRFDYPALEAQINVLMKRFVKNQDKHVKILGRNVVENIQNKVFMIDGELIYKEGRSENRNAMSGKLNKALNGKDIPVGEEVTFHAFDLMYNFGACLEDRKRVLRAFLEERNGRHVTYHDMFNTKAVPIIKISKEYDIQSLSDLGNVFDNLVQNGYEGLVIKDRYSIYEFSERSQDWYKMKPVKTCDLECVGYEYGTGKYEGMIGSLKLQDSSGNYTVSVGSGLTDSDRGRNFMVEFYGKIVEIKYTDKTEDSLFLPRFVCIRNDKDEADNLMEE